MFLISFTITLDSALYLIVIKDLGAYPQVLERSATTPLSQLGTGTWSMGVGITAIGSESARNRGRIEWPTIAVAAAVYGGFGLVTWWYEALPWWVVLPLGAYLVTHGLEGAAPRAEMVSAQGFEMGRPSIIHIAIEQEGGAISRVQVGGQSVSMGGGWFQLP